MTWGHRSLSQAWTHRSRGFLSARKLVVKKKQSVSTLAIRMVSFLPRPSRVKAEREGWVAGV